MTSTRTTRKHVETAALQLARELGETSATVHGGSAVNGVSWHVTIGGSTFRVGMTPRESAAHLRAMADGAAMLARAQRWAAVQPPAPMVDDQGRPVGDVASVEHSGTSRNGNPSYRITLADGRAFVTASDASCGYSATNYRPTRGATRRVALTLSRGRVVDITDVTA